MNKVVVRCSIKSEFFCHKFKMCVAFNVDVWLLKSCFMLILLKIVNIDGAYVKGWKTTTGLPVNYRILVLDV